MTIAALQDVHDILNIDISITSSDAEITRWLTKAELILTNWLRAFGGTLTGAALTDQSLIFTEAAIAAWMFRRVREGPAVAQAYLEFAKEGFNSYKMGVLMYPQVPGLTPMESVSSSSTTGAAGTTGAGVVP